MRTEGRVKQKFFMLKRYLVFAHLGKGETYAGQKENFRVDASSLESARRRFYKFYQRIWVIDEIKTVGVLKMDIKHKGEFR